MPVGWYAQPIRGEKLFLSLSQIPCLGYLVPSNEYGNVFLAVVEGTEIVVTKSVVKDQLLAHLPLILEEEVVSIYEHLARRIADGDRRLIDVACQKVREIPHV